MPLRAKWSQCWEHNKYERLQYVCTVCGRYGCRSHWEQAEELAQPGKAWMCETTRARLRRKPATEVQG